MKLLQIDQFDNITMIQHKWKILSLYSVYDIKKIYRELCHIYHPDKNGNQLDFIQVQSEYDRLKKYWETIPKDIYLVLENREPIGYYNMYGTILPIIKSKGKSTKYYITQY